MKAPLVDSFWDGSALDKLELCERRRDLHCTRMNCGIRWYRNPKP